MKNGIINLKESDSSIKNLVIYLQYLEDCLGNLHDEGECDGGAASSQLDLHPAPDAIAELDGLVAHVLRLAKVKA